jgi:hypothetical protein
MCSFGENCHSTDFIEMVKLMIVFDLVARGTLGGSTIRMQIDFFKILPLACG